MESFSIGNTHAEVTKKSTAWFFVLAPATLIYIGLVVHVAWNIQPFSRFLPNTIDPVGIVLLHLTFAVLPLVALIACYVRWLTKAEKSARKKLIAEFEGCELVRSIHNPNLIYHVKKRNDDLRIHSMEAVWTTDGRCEKGQEYADVDASSVRQFDSARFLNG